MDEATVSIHIEYSNLSNLFTQSGRKYENLIELGKHGLLPGGHLSYLQRGWIRLNEVCYTPVNVIPHPQHTQGILTQEILLVRIPICLGSSFMQESLPTGIYL